MLFLSTRPGLRLPGRIPHLDKCAHFAEYAVLGGLLMRAVWISGLRSGRGWWLVLLVVAMLAGGDERLQAAVPGRDSSPLDWLADLSGGALGALSGWWWLRSRRGRVTPEAWTVGRTEG